MIDSKSRPNRIMEILSLVRRRRASGENVSDDSVIAEYPQLQPELERELQKLRIVQAAASVYDAEQRDVDRGAATLTIDLPFGGKSIQQSLLLAAAAVRLEYLDLEQLKSVCCHWVERQSDPLSKLMLEDHYLDQRSLDEVEGFIERRMARYGDDLTALLASIMDQATRSALIDVGNDEVGLVVKSLPGTREHEFVDAIAASRDGPSRYTLTKVHAEGGLGRVWIARDIDLNREVALKEIKPRIAESGGSQQARRRFLCEAQLTGQLEHPNIVPVYELGRHEDGEPYYTMRFIRGQTMKEAIHDYYDNSGGPDRLTMSRLLQYFVSICNAISYAHSRGVVHRDLKPANIALGSFGEVLVLDWGLAKLGPKQDEDQNSISLLNVGASEETNFGQAVGTPAYMAPEQAAGDVDRVDATTDIFGLGAILFHILTGRAPHEPREGETTQQLCQRIASSAATSARYVDHRVPRALDAICTKAMASEKANRYGSAADLADDVQRYLADEPVSAYRESAYERATRWSRRHRAWTRAIATAVVLVAIVFIGATIIVDHARKEERRQRALAQASRQEALERFHEAREAVDLWLTGASDFLRYYPGVQSARKQLLELAVRDYERFAERKTDDPQLEIERGRTLVRLGDVHRLLREFDDAETAYRSAEKLFVAMASKGVEVVECEFELGKIRSKLGALLAETGRRDEATEEFQRAEIALQKLIDAGSDELRLASALATCLTNHGELLWSTGQREQARRNWGRATAIFEALRAGAPAKLTYQAGLATVLTMQGKMYAEESLHDEALRNLGRAIDVLSILVTAEPDDPRYLESRSEAIVIRAQVLRKLGQTAQALDAYSDATRDFQALSTSLPDVALFQENLALTQTNSAQLLRKLGLASKALPQATSALVTFNELAARPADVDRYNERMAVCLDVMGQIFHDLDRDTDAVDHFDLALAAFERLVEQSPKVRHYRHQLANCQSHVGQLLHKLGDYQAAIVRFEVATELLTGLSKNAPEVAAYRDALATVSRRLGDAQFDSGQHDEAVESFDRARQLWSELADTSPTPEYLYNFAWLAVNCPDEQFRDPQAAIKHLEIARKQAPDNATYCAAEAAAHYRIGNWSEAIESLREAISLRGEGHAMDWFFLAMAQWQGGQADEANESFAKAVKWMEANRPGDLDLRRIRREAEDLLKPAPQSNAP